jgi:hypothetical protein
VERDLTNYGRYDSFGVVSGTTSATSLTSSGSANTKGSYVTLATSTTFDATEIQIILSGQESSTSTSDNLVDVAIGASGSEQILFADLYVEAFVGFNRIYTFPCNIPAGSRISARAQSTVTTSTPTATILLSNRKLYGEDAVVTTYGAVTGTTKGTAVTASVSANTKGSYTQIVSSTSRPIKSFYWCACNNGTTRSSVFSNLCDLAIGASGSETILIPDFHISLPSKNVAMPELTKFDIDIPSGARIAIRSAASTGSVSFGHIIYGIG